jgi:hypothetical protein
MAFQEVKVRAGRYELYNGDEHVGDVYRMPYRNMSGLWRVVFNPDHRRYGEEIIKGSKKAGMAELRSSVIFPL